MRAAEKLIDSYLDDIDYRDDFKRGGDTYKLCKQWFKFSHYEYNLQRAESSRSGFVSRIRDIESQRWLDSIVDVTPKDFRKKSEDYIRKYG